jgi:hypothetical protein
MKGSVKVMLSYDYCHFEISLSSDEDTSLSQIDDMRKDAQRLACKAIKQYKIAKSVANEDSTWQKNKFYEKIDAIRQKPANEWTPEDKAYMKVMSDRNWDEYGGYDYEDEDDDLFYQ